MNELLNKINKKFNDKYNYLKLLNVVYDSDAFCTTITFLYPYTREEILGEDKKELEDFIQEFLLLNSQIKLKFRKSFLDDKLLVGSIIEFFKTCKKGLLPYLNQDNIITSNEELDVKIKLSLNQDVLSLLNEAEFKAELKEFLDKNFIANFQIEIVENEEKLPDEIAADDILPSSTKARRYKVEIEKLLFGGEIIPCPEYIGDVKYPKEAVILSGFMSGLMQRKYIAKTGKYKGQERILYTFQLQENSGKIECTYFCGKAQEKKIEAIDDMSMVVCVGDVREGFTGRLNYTVRKMAICAPCVEEGEFATEEKVQYKHKKVVFPDLYPKNDQTNLFEEKPKYNDFIMMNNFVVFDIETTGLDSEMCEITEIGAVKIEQGEITERFSSFAKPNGRIPREVEELTHITNEMVQSAPKIEDVIIDFCEWSKGCIICGHNIVAFDLKFVKKVMDKIGIPFENQVVDTLIEARKSALRVSNFKLGTLVKAFGIELVGAHRAFNDAYATAQLLMELNRVK